VVPKPTRNPATNMVTANSARGREYGRGDGGEKEPGDEVA